MIFKEKCLNVIFNPVFSESTLEIQIFIIFCTKLEALKGNKNCESFRQSLIIRINLTVNKVI